MPALSAACRRNFGLALLLVHAGATWFMAGLIWTVQIVHYPSFADVGETGFADLHAQHGTRIGALLAVPWAVEVLTALALVVATPDGVPRALAWTGLLIALPLVASTVLIFAPLHSDLSAGFDIATIDRLVALNWSRTAAWSVRAVIAGAMIWLAVRAG